MDWARSLKQRDTLGRSIAGVVATACFVAFLEEMMRQFGFFNHQQAVWWPTNGLALALLVRAERRRWPWIISGVLLGSLSLQIYFGALIVTDLANMAANASGPLLAAWMLPRFEQLEKWMQEPGLISRFVTFAIVLAPLLSSTIRASYVHLYLHRPDFWQILQGRAVADMLGYALFTPLVLVLFSGDAAKLVKGRALPRTILLLIVVGGSALLVFAQSSFALTFVLASITVLVALHLGFSASVIAVNLVSLIATVETMHGHGPFTLGGGAIVGARIFLLQSFLTLSMLTVFAVSVIQIERDVFQSRLMLTYGQMELLATIDPVTGVSNRRRFEEALAVEWARASRARDSIAVLMIDADHFKSYNDTYGHIAGDDCLQTMARAARKMERRSTDLLARYGGEEFVFLLPMNTTESALQIAEAIRASIEGLYEEEDSGLGRKVTVSIGCAAMVPGPGLSSKILVGAADQALYRAKLNGRNRVEVVGLSDFPDRAVDLDRERV